jgi:succinate dehydrogenase/fumarate reductase-like Fe-S protein
MRISPLKNLPPIRDLVVDRWPLDRRITEYALHISPDVQEPLGIVAVPQLYQRLIGCLECYGCVSSCPHFDWRDAGFGGPSVFVRLAQLHLDPRDNADRRAQARSLGIERCRDCSQCRCVKGIAIRRDAIGMLLGETTP